MPCLSVIRPTTFHISDHFPQTTDKFQLYKALLDNGNWARPLSSEDY